VKIITRGGEAGKKEGFLPIGYAAYDTVRVAVPLNCWYPAVPSGFTTA
jgi:glycine cleavage system aminomethyltransferase T